jgi:hypothetical protein
MLALIERWLKDHQRLVLLLILLSSVLLRVGFFLEINPSPCIRQHLWDQSDMNFFDLWAQNIAADDWLSNKVLHPYHSWHHQVATRYFAMHPEAAAAMAQKSASSGISEDQGRALWNQWYGGKTFHQGPLYPYLLALTYKTLGVEVRWVFLWQMLLGVCSNILVYLIARRHFGVLVAAVAGLLAVLCSPMLYYNLVLLRATLLIFMGLLLVQVTDLALERNSWPWWLLTGLVCGLAVLLKAIFFPFWLGVLALLSYRYWGNRRVLLGFAMALTLGLVICLLPVAARNVAVGAPVLSLQSIGPITFVLSNAEDYSIHGRSLFSLKYAPQIMEKAGGSLSTAVIETLKTHPSPWSYLEQLWEKFRSIWTWYEIPNNANFYYYRLYSKVLAYLPVTFLLLAPLSLVGLVMAIGHRVHCIPLYLAVFLNISTLSVFGVTSRYRISLMALLIPFAAYALVQTINWLKSGKRLQVTAALAIVVLVTWWTIWSFLQNRPLIRNADYLTACEIYYIPMAREALKKKDWQRGAEILSKSMQYKPPVVHRIGPSHPPRTSTEANLAFYYARLHQGYALSLEMIGRKDAAFKEKRRAAELREAIQKTKPTYHPRQARP